MDKEMLEAMKALLGDALAPIKSELAEVKSDLTAVKSDLIEVRSDLTAVKSDLTEVRSDLTAVESDLTEVKSDLTAVKSDLIEVRSELSEVKQNQAEQVEYEHGTRALVENISKNIRLLAEGHSANAAKLQQLDRIETTLNDVKSDTEILKDIVSWHSEALKKHNTII